MDHSTIVKVCTSCKQEKPLAQFHKSKDGKYGHASNCQVCAYDKNKQWFAKKIKEDPDYYRYRNLKKLYGISREDYDSTLSKQEGKCAICRKDAADSVHGNLYVDHDHGTGNIRGLLCDKCNTGLGHFQDSADIMSEAIKYLNRNKQQ